MRSALALALLAITLGGCSSGPKVNWNFEPRRVTIITEPEGAMVTQIHPYCQGSYSLGLTPIQDRSVTVVTKITKMRNMSLYDAQKMYEQVDNVVVQIDKEGFERYYGTLRTDPKETLVHTIKLIPKQLEQK